MSKLLRAHLSAIYAVLLFGCASMPGLADGSEDRQGPRNVIFLLGDGMGPAYIKAYRAFANDPLTPVIDPLSIDPLLKGSIATDSIAMSCEGEDETDCVRNPYGVTDSAASATAYATGVDTINGRLGVDVNGEPLTSVLELAARQGKGTGVVSTSQVTHASPAAFVAHVMSRRDYPNIANQYYDNQVNGLPMVQVILGGGVDDFQREDRDVTAQLVAAGYDHVQDREALLAADALPLLGLFAPVGMPRHWDRPDDSPSLAEMTGKAIELLSANDAGFFLMVEGSQIDWAGHGRDISGVISEMQGFLEAVDVALAYAWEQGDTLVVITADHETGGLSLGRDGIYAWNPVPMRGMTLTPEGITEQFMMDEEASLAALLQAAVPFELTSLEREALGAVERDEDEAYDALTEIMTERTLTGWTTHGHTGVDVPLYVSGPGSEAFQGVLQNEELGRLLIQAVQSSGNVLPSP